MNDQNNQQPGQSSGSQMNQPSQSFGGGQGKQPEGGRKSRGWTGIIVIIILILLIILVSGGDRQDEDGTDVTNGDETSLNGDTLGDDSDEDGEEVSEPRGQGAMNMSPVTAGGDVYAFSDIDWLFSTGSAGNTMVRTQFVGFTRNQIAIDVLPYRLGEYGGTCSEIAVPSGAASFVSGANARPITFAECVGAGSREQLGVYQNGQLIETYSRRTTTGGSFGQMTKVQTIDLAGIVE
ncbi:MAG: hypothetical protein COU11_02125 [Candidatus Harrisonbacteria bacterium CG10_big_fil_rev_8_21_14_0_10_49_15]|uniref:Uncharacterized protein n=1 Tax=Candidatus Harrisonbacteria bacterium CG10_big_fil_rev_8_21_14_0_10_49_15 TaxID=1974587 RepID=A0A2H0UMV3_9BACT|nr:MAG: hypothetical protein COU11_02125 [Candidatus Harrisonbacteria bacterium CG10_big_fil_rev_8_21_14_0_10_49_15]